MRIVNAGAVPDLAWTSPDGAYRGSGKQLSEALGRVPESTDSLARHPFDVELARIAPGDVPHPYHAHSAQWEFYYIVSGTGRVRYDGGSQSIAPGDALLFKPGEAHQLVNDGSQDLVLFVVADNPFGEAWWYPDSETWSVAIPTRRTVRDAGAIGHDR